VPIVVGVFVEADRHLLAHVGLPVERTFAATDRSLMERTSCAMLKARPVQEDASIVDGLGDPFPVIVLEDRPPHLLGPICEFPLAGFKTLDLLPNRLTVFLVYEVRAVGTATMLVLGSELGKHTRAAAAVDTAMVRGQKAHIELPGIAVLIIERDPLVQVSGDVTHAGGRYRAPATVPDMAGEFDDIRIRLEAITEELADLAIIRLRESIDAGGQEIPVDEKRLTRARRAIEKAIHLLQEPDDNDW